MSEHLEQSIFQITNKHYFNALALAIFKHQFEQNKTYQEYCKLLKKNPENVNSILEIPFLPIQFFKSHSIICGDKKSEIVFSSSGTTGIETSKHLVSDLSIYKQSFLTAFDHFYPNWKNSAIIGLLPSYLERKGSSLIYMVNELILKSSHTKSGFHLTLDQEMLDFMQNNDSPKILIGVTFALLDLADQKISLKNTTVIETGGMKGKRKEIIREELHEILKKGLNQNTIHSEYGMTELLSQAYYQGKNFICPTWMKVLIRETTDPLSTFLTGKGALNVIDLANIHSCSFIATDDLGEVFSDGEFSVLGRLDHSQIRGCNLMTYG